MGSEGARRVVVVTGGAQGLGRACAEAIGAEGASVALLDVDLRRATAAARALEACGAGPSAAFACNVRDAAAVADAFAAVLERFGHLDVLVNNAGIGDTGRTEDVAEETWDLVLDTCLKGTFLCSQQAARAMIARDRGGVIVNMASMLGVTQFPNRAAYASAKAAVVALTRVTAGEWAPHGIRVNALAPGYVITELVQRAIDDGGLEPAQILAWTPLGRMGELAEVGAAARYLASEEAGFMTGQVLVLDGGFSSYGAWWPPRPRR